MTSLQNFSVKNFLFFSAIVYVVLLILVGAPQGLCINTAISSARGNVQHQYMGLVMTLMGGGVSVAALVLPKIYKTLFNTFFDNQPEIFTEACKNSTVLENLECKGQGGIKMLFLKKDI